MTIIILSHRLVKNISTVNQMTLLQSRFRLNALLKLTGVLVKKQEEFSFNNFSSIAFIRPSSSYNI